MLNQNLNRNSSPNDKAEASNAVFEFLADALFDKISFISFPFTQTKQVYYMRTDGIAAGDFPWGGTAPPGISMSSINRLDAIEGPVTDTARYWGISRIPNTSEGKFLSNGKKSRMRCSFYTENGDQLDGYLLSPVVYDSFTSLNFFTSMDIFRSYVGLKFEEGRAYVVIKEAGAEERLVELNSVNVSGSGASTTYRLDIECSGKDVTIYIDSINVGTFPCDIIGNITTQRTFLPLLSPAKSLDGSAVGITIENYQFIQNN